MRSAVPRKLLRQWQTLLFALLWLANLLSVDSFAQGESAAQTAVPAAVAPAAAGRLQPIFVPTAELSMPGLPALGEELASAFIAVLRKANLDARPAVSSGKAEAKLGSVLALHLESAGEERVRLTAIWRGTTISALGDLEHLDDLVDAVFADLRPHLVAEGGPADLRSPPSPTVPSLSALPSAPTAHATPAQAAASASAARKDSSIAQPPPKLTDKITPASASVGKPSAKPPGTAPIPSVTAKSPTSPPVSPATRPPGKPPDMAPASLLPEPAHPMAPQRSRIAVHIVGEPFSALPSSFYGLGTTAQQIFIQYLQSRLRVQPIPSRLVGLVGGMEAMAQSLRLGARHTLMARFDTFIDSPGTYAAYGARTLSGRLHVVLLLDGRPLVDRSLALPPTIYYQTESPNVVLGRLLTATLDNIAGELSTHLYTPL